MSLGCGEEGHEQAGVGSRAREERSSRACSARHQWGRGYFSTFRENRRARPEPSDPRSVTIRYRLARTVLPEQAEHATRSILSLSEPACTSRSRPPYSDGGCAACTAPLSRSTVPKED